jgi:hypothetical protein
MPPARATRWLVSVTVLGVLGPVVVRLAGLDPAGAHRSVPSFVVTTLWVVALWVLMMLALRGRSGADDG